MRILLTTLAMLAFTAAVRAEDPLAGLVFTNGQAYTLAEFAGATVAVVNVYEDVLLGQC